MRHWVNWCTYPGLTRVVSDACDFNTALFVYLTRYGFFECFCWLDEAS
jgi:hypothetical protein